MDWNAADPVEDLRNLREQLRNEAGVPKPTQVILPDWYIKWIEEEAAKGEFNGPAEYLKTSWNELTSEQRTEIIGWFWAASNPYS